MCVYVGRDTYEDYVHGSTPPLTSLTCQSTCIMWDINYVIIVAAVEYVVGCGGCGGSDGDG